MALFGIETEYGIYVEGKGAADLVAESRSLVNSYRGKFAKPWNYRGEDPRNDMRGFRADRLNYDPDDAQFDDPHSKPLPAEIERADHVLVNGARLYNDHGHPEYSTPECSSLIDLVTHDKAGERVVLACAREREAQIDATISIYKNNTDFHGSSYGTHENYLIARQRPFGEVISVLVPFLVTRIIYTGAGKVGIEPRGKSGTYQLSQRADFFSEEASVDTLHRRPLVNTRDEPHADPRKWRRLHVIAGDANVAEYSTALKVGTMSLICELIDSGWSPGDIHIKNPTNAIKDVSRDASHKWIVPLTNKREMSATDIQRIYLDQACKLFGGRGGDTDWTLTEWRTTLEMLDENPMKLSDKLDWVAKKRLIDDYVESEGGKWDEYQLQAFDMAYCDVDPDVSLHQALVDAGEMQRLTTDAAVARAMTEAPTDTRAAIRSELISRFGESIGAIGWSKVVLRTVSESWVADLDDYITPERVAQGLERIRNAADLPTLITSFRNDFV